MSQWFNPSEPLSEAEATPQVSQIYRRIWRFMLEFKAGLGIAIGLSFLTSVAFALLPWPIRYLIDGVLLSEQLDVRPFGTYAAASDGDKVRLGLILAGTYLVIQLVAAVGAAASFYFLPRRRCS